MTASGPLPRSLPITQPVITQRALRYRALTALAIALLSALVSWGCVERVHLIVTTQVLAHQSLAIDTVVTGALCAVGALIALWYAATSCLAFLTLALRAAGRVSDRLVADRLAALVHQLGPAPLRRLVGVGAAGILAVALAATPASAASSGFAPDDLGYSESTSSSAPSESGPAGSAPSEQARSEPMPPDSTGELPTSEASETPAPTHPPVVAPTPSTPATEPPAGTPNAPEPSSAASPASTPPSSAATAPRTDVDAAANGAPVRMKRVVVGDAPAIPPTPAQPAPEQSLPDQPPPPSSTYVVAPGDSLWTITASLLGEEATTQAIAAQWPRLYQANLDLIGSNPDLINPGTPLRVPGLTATEN